MAQGQSQSIRRVVRSRDLFQVQEPLGHVHHLAFFRPSIACNCLLHLEGGLFKDRNAVFRTGKESDPASVSHLNAGCDIRIKKQFLNGDRIGLQQI